MSSAMTIILSDAAATIFSRSNAPPPPFIRRSASSNSSAPSTVMSRRCNSSSGANLMFRLSACSRVASEVGTQTISLNPSVSFAPNPSTKKRAVEPVPSPNFMPLSTNSSARKAAFCFICSTGLSGCKILSCQLIARAPLLWFPKLH